MLRLKKLREEKKISQQKMAMDLQVSQASVSKYELALSEPDISMILRLAKYFHVSTDYLLGNSEIRAPLSKSELSGMELKHILKYKLLNASQREKAEAYIDGLLDAGAGKTQ